MADAPTLVNTCAVCGIKYTHPTWRGLKYLGTKPDFGVHMEFRECGCGNRLTILLDDDGNYVRNHPDDDTDEHDEI